MANAHNRNDPTEPEFVLSELRASLRLAYVPPCESATLCLDRISTVRAADHMVDVSSEVFHEPMNNEPALIPKWVEFKSNPPFSLAADQPIECAVASTLHLHEQENLHPADREDCNGAARIALPVVQSSYETRCKGRDQSNEKPDDLGRLHPKVAQGVSTTPLVRGRVEPNPERHQKDGEAEDDGGNERLARREVKESDEDAEDCGR